MKNDEFPEFWWRKKHPEGVVFVGKLTADRKCISCERSLKGHPVFGYPHRRGYNVDGHRLWLFVECIFCGYQNSFRKLGLDVSNID